MEFVILLTAALALVSLIGYGARLGYATAAGLVGDKSEIPPLADLVEALGIFAAISGIIYRRDLAIVGVLLIALGLLLKKPGQGFDWPLERPLAALALIALVGIGACRTLRAFGLV
jgi:hypothetical protein